VLRWTLEIRSRRMTRARMLPPIHQTVRGEPFHKGVRRERVWSDASGAGDTAKTLTRALRARTHLSCIVRCDKFGHMAVDPAYPEKIARAQVCTHLARSPTKISFHGFIFAQQRACCFGATKKWLRIQLRARRWPQFVLHPSLFHPHFQTAGRSRKQKRIARLKFFPTVRVDSES